MKRSITVLFFSFACVAGLFARTLTLTPHEQAIQTALETAPWVKTIPQELIPDNLYPLTAMGEAEENWLPVLQPIAQSLIKGATTPLEAAMAINKGIWDIVDVHYSTARERADQAPLHSMRIHKASCSGLSILLVDACRSVGIPARIISCQWRKKPGNHTWVEVWSRNRWHPLGASESDPPDRLWFLADAAHADPYSHDYAIYALQGRASALRDPLWQQPAINVTMRYLRKISATPSLSIEVYEQGQRVIETFNYRGKRYHSPGPLQDLNDLVVLPFDEDDTLLQLTIDDAIFQIPAKANERYRLHLPTDDTPAKVETL